MKELDSLIVKRGTLPDDDRIAPNWMKIKNDQFEDVDVSNNTADDLVALSNEEFNEFVSHTHHEMILVYLSTLNKNELQRFYNYLDNVIRLNDGSSAKEQFQNAMKRLDGAEISDMSKARATLELPLSIAYGKSLYQNTMKFRSEIAKNYFDYDSDDVFKFYEGHFTKVLYEEMKYIPTSFEQIINHYKENAYDPNDESQQQFIDHLVKRFGPIIYYIYRLNFVSQVTNGSVEDNALGWFVETLMQERPFDVMSLEEKEPLAFYLSVLYNGIATQDDEMYLYALIMATFELFRYYPLHKESCEYALVEMMKSVSLKDVSIVNANNFIAFFERLPMFYDKLDFDTIYKLKELINHTLVTYKPQDNKIFDNPEVKNKLLLLNYRVDMEDLYYEGGE